MKNQLQTDLFVAFTKSFSSVPSTSSLSAMTWQHLSTQSTFQRQINVLLTLWINVENVVDQR